MNDFGEKEYLIANASLDGSRPFVRIAERQDFHGRDRVSLDRTFQTIPIEVMQITLPESKRDMLDTERPVAFAGRVSLDGSDVVVVGGHYRSGSQFGDLDVVGPTKQAIDKVAHI